MHFWLQHKWRRISTAYIGYGKGKMDVDWGGDAPESAPGERKKIGLVSDGSVPKRIAKKETSPFPPSVCAVFFLHYWCGSQILQCACRSLTR